MINKIFHKIKRKKRHKNNIMPNFLSKKEYYKKRKLYKINLSFLFKINKFTSKAIINTIFILVLFLISILFLGPILKVNKIEIIRKDYITNIDIAYKSLNYIRGKSIFLVNFDNIKQKLQKYQSNINEVNIKIFFPDLLKIEIGSYTGLFNTDIKGKNYIITKNGTFIPMKKNSEIFDLKIFKSNLENVQIPDYKINLDSKILININYLISKLKENIVTFKIKSNYYYVKERELHLITSSGIRLIYDLNTNVDNQIKKSVILNKQYFKITDPGLVYIDFRVNDKIYYCKDDIKSVCLGHIKRIYDR